MTRYTHPASSGQVRHFLGHAATLALLITLSLALPTRAGIVGINTPGTSTASVNFDDTNSTAPPAGITNTGPVTSPWNGSTVSLATTTDPNTGDFASGSVDASFVFAGNTYAINLNNITLNQLSTNTGFAELAIAFSVEYQLDAAGLPNQPTLYPNFVVNGTVQSSSSSFAALNGYIDYVGVNTAGAISVLETVNYNSLWNTPGPFSGIAAGVPVNGTTPVLVGGTTLTLNGYLKFIVDPASINAFSVQAPEPASWVLAALGLAALGIVARKRRSATD